MLVFIRFDEHKVVRRPQNLRLHDTNALPEYCAHGREIVFTYRTLFRIVKTSPEITERIIFCLKRTPRKAGDQGAER